MTMKPTNGRKNSKRYLRPRNQKRTSKKLIAVTTVANALAGVQYHNDRENQQAQKAGKKAHLTHTLLNDLVLIVMFVLVASALVLIFIGR